MEKYFDLFSFPFTNNAILNLTRLLALRFSPTYTVLDKSFQTQFFLFSCVNQVATNVEQTLKKDILRAFLHIQPNHAHMKMDVFQY